MRSSRCRQFFTTVDPIRLSGFRNTTARSDGVTDGMNGVQVTLTDAEASTLREVLESYLSDLRMEIVDTEDKDFREKLKSEEKILKKIIDALAK